MVDDRGRPVGNASGQLLTVRGSPSTACRCACPGDERAELHVPAEGAAVQSLDLEPEPVLQQTARRAGGNEVVRRRRAAVVLRPLEEIGFLVIVGDECDAPAGGAGHAASIRTRNARSVVGVAPAARR